jgi:glycosyltransferase involved in cell wall biosynthesis
MKIALAIENSIRSPGGVEVLTRELVRGIGNVCELFLASPDDDASLESLGINNSGLRDHFRIDHSSESWRSDLRKWLSARSVDLTHLQSGGTYSWASEGRVPSLIKELVSDGIRCINTNHQNVSPWDEDFQGISFARKFAGFLRKWPSKARHLSMTESEIMVSDHDLRIASRCYPFHAHKMHRIYHSRIDPSMVLAPIPESRRIVSLATITQRKGQAVLVDAFCRIAPSFPEWTLHLYGMCHDQRYIYSIRKIIADAGFQERVFIEGPTDDHLAVLAGAEIYVQPSYLEALGLSLQEALFLERPCIGSRVGGIPELIEHGIDGLLFSPGNVSELAEALSRFMSDERERGRLGTAARLKISRLGMNRDQMAASYLDLYRQTIQSPTKTR